MNSLPAYLTAVTAAIVAWVGYEQFRLARERLKLDLFEKRFVVYKAAQRVLSAVLRDAAVGSPDLLEYRRDSQDAAFLFGQEIVDYLATLDHRILKLGAACDELKDLACGPERSRLAEEKRRLCADLLGELPKLKDVFAPYLRFGVWRGNRVMRALGRLWKYVWGDAPGR
jgi:hypothetical protein